MFARAREARLQGMWRLEDMPARSAGASMRAHARRHARTLTCRSTTARTAAVLGSASTASRSGIARNVVGRPGPWKSKRWRQRRQVHYREPILGVVLATVLDIAVLGAVLHVTGYGTRYSNTYGTGYGTRYGTGYDSPLGSGFGRRGLAELGERGNS